MHVRSVHCGCCLLFLYTVFSRIIIIDVIIIIIIIITVFIIIGSNLNPAINFQYISFSSLIIP